MKRSAQKTSEKQRAGAGPFPPGVQGTPVVPPPTYEAIAQLAYFIWLNEGCPEGCAEKHWLEAEAQLVKTWEAEVAQCLADADAVVETTASLDTPPKLHPAFEPQLTENPAPIAGNRRKGARPRGRLSMPA